MASTSGYDRVPSAPVSRSSSPVRQLATSTNDKIPTDEEKRRIYIAQLREQERALAQDPRFERPAPSAWKRAALIAFVVVMFWMAISMRLSIHKAKPKPEVIYAHRYSKEHKYRPAASPIITKTLPDGRIRIHGAAPTHVNMQRPRA